MHDTNSIGTHCPHCGKSLEALSGAAFCPFCGGAVPNANHSAGGPAAGEPEELREALKRAAETSDPRKKFELLKAAEGEYPQSLGVAQELLFLGRLYERGGKNVDFSIIKCFLWMLYLEPEQFTKKRKDELREELFAHPQLQKCLALCDDPDAFLWMYLLRLAEEFIKLFLRGDSRYMRRIFGLGSDSRAPKFLADPVSCMILSILGDEQLSPEQRELLTRALYQAFSKDMAGETKWLDEKLSRVGVDVSGMR